MLKEIIQNIHSKQLENFYAINEFRSYLKTKQRGLYWIWTKLDFSELKKTKPVAKPSIHVPIDKLVKLREGLNNVSTIEKNGFKVIYNGIGGYKKVPAAFGLRERINQELNCKDKKTGTLNLLKRGFNEESWAISFFNFDDPENLEILKELKCENPYKEFANQLEIAWRLEYGTPILCRH